MTLRENERRDRLLAHAFLDAYQRGWDARSTSEFFADDIWPLILRNGRNISQGSVLREAEALHVRSDPEFGSWPKFVQRSLRMLLTRLQRYAEANGRATSSWQPRRARH